MTDLKALVEAAGRAKAAREQWIAAPPASHTGNRALAAYRTIMTDLASPENITAITLLATRLEAAEAENARLRGALEIIGAREPSGATTYPNTYKGGFRACEDWASGTARAALVGG